MVNILYHHKENKDERVMWLIKAHLKHSSFLVVFKWETIILHKPEDKDFPGGAEVKNPPANAGDTGSSPGPGRSHMPQGTKPVHHNYWTHGPQLPKPMCLEPVLRNENPQ